MRAAIYARISLDRDGEGDGVSRQLEDCRALCQGRGWDIVGEYVDNDISAYSGKRRPEFERMLLDLANQEIDVVVVWKTDRLARRGRDLQRFLDAASVATLTSCTEPEFTGATGLLMLRIINGFAEHESGVKSERVARKMAAKATKGDPHAGGVRCFGYTADGKFLVPDEASLLQGAAQRLLAGETASDVVRGWKREGVQTVRGGQWTPANLWKLLRSPRMAGLRLVDGTPYKGNFPPVLSFDTWKRLCAIQTRKRSAPRRMLLTNLLVCGECGTGMVGAGGHQYACRQDIGCYSVAITAKVDEFVSACVVSALDSEMLAKLKAMRPDTGEVDRAALAAAEADLTQLGKDYYVEKRISSEVFFAANGELEARVKQLRSRVARAGDVIEQIEPGKLAETWDSRSQSWKRSVISATVEKIVVTKGHAPLSERVKIHWRAQP